MKTGEKLFNKIMEMDIPKWAKDIAADTDPIEEVFSENCSESEVMEICRDIALKYWLELDGSDFTLFDENHDEVISGKLLDAGIFDDPDPMFQDKLEKYIEDKTGIKYYQWEIG